MINKLNIEIKPLTPDLKHLALDFLRRFFFKDEPLVECLNLTSDAKAVEALEEYAMKSVADNVSLMAIADNYRIVGIAMNSIRVKDSPEPQEATDPIFGKIARFLGYLDKQVDTFKKYPDIDKFLSLDMISVDESCRGQGLAKKLVEKTRDLARTQGLKMMRVDCTSCFSAKAMARLDFECIYELPYANYIENGLQVFQTPPPHVSAKVYVKRI